MNLKYSIIVTAAIVSFFALCFVWEARSDLPKNEGKDALVGACGNYGAVYTDHLCPDFPSQSCHALLDYDEIEFPCPCGYTLSKPGIPIACESNKSSTSCTSSSGTYLDFDQDGDFSFQLRANGCGSRVERPCNEVSIGTYTLTHFCPEDHITYTIDIPTCECVEDSNESHKTTKTCGAIIEPKGC